MDKRVRDVQGVFAAVRLGDDQIVRIDADGTALQDKSQYLFLA